MGLVCISIEAKLPVLVAEDNQVNQKVVVALLKKLGLAAELVNNGLEAVEKYTTNEYAAIFMDCQMPVMDGYEATRRIRALNRPRVPIIALTAATASRDRQLALEAGMDDFVSKPIQFEELARILARCLELNGRPA